MTEKTNPMWAQKVDKIGRRKHHPSEYLIAIIVNIVILYIINHLLAWNAPFLTDEWTAVLWILNISVVFTIVANFIWLFFDPTWFRALLKIISNIISIVFMISFYQIYPLEFNSLSYGSALDLVFRIVLIIGIIGTVIGTLVEFVHLLMNRD